MIGAPPTPSGSRDDRAWQTRGRGRFPRPAARATALWITLFSMVGPGCDRDAGTAPTPSRVLVTPVSVDLFVAETYTARASVWDDAGRPLDIPVAWTSSDPDVVAVSAGNLTAVGPGTARVTATAEGHEGAVEVRVVAVLPLEFPLVAERDTDYWIDYGVPHTQPGATTDVLCGPKVINEDFHGFEHRGVDFALKDMLVMDTGVTVYAAAAGTVVETHDGEFDRNVWFHESSAPANFVALEHRDGIRTVYSSLRKNSVAVFVGQDVLPGTALGEIGSSGKSEIAHLHFEVQLGDRSVDPYTGPCATGPRLWREARAFDGDPHVIRAHVSDWPQPGPRHYKLQVPGPADTIVAGGVITPWAQQMNVPKGARVGIRIIDAAGDVRIDNRYARNSPWPTMYYAHAPFTTDTITDGGGTWVMEYWFDGQVAAVDSFVLVIPETL